MEQGAAACSEGLRVLVVEDQALIAADLVELLEELGHTVVGTANGVEQALSLAASAHPDLATVDINLVDGATGPQIAAELVQTFGMHVLFVTSEPNAAPSGRPEFIGVVCKPCQASNLSEAISQCAALMEKARAR